MYGRCYCSEIYYVKLEISIKYFRAQMTKQFTEHVETCLTIKSLVEFLQLTSLIHLKNIQKYLSFYIFLLHFFFYSVHFYLPLWYKSWRSFTLIYPWMFAILTRSGLTDFKAWNVKLSPNSVNITTKCKILFVIYGQQTSFTSTKGIFII